ncbi:alpha/beta hydrolase [Kocuria sp. KSNUG]|uniref:alpha/beta hydrolase n=1 Tax=Kocuria sp. KSNUG TaxID=3136676 RepID=UPI003C2D3867
MSHNDSARAGSGTAPAPSVQQDGLEPRRQPGEVGLDTASPSPVTVPEGWFRAGAGITVHNVSRPTIAPFLPAPETATGASVLIAPGGGFMMLSMSGEGWDVAQWLASHGVAAFVLKYRLLPTPEYAEGVMAQLMQRVGTPEAQEDSGWFQEGARLATEDAFAALDHIRAEAGHYGIDPHRIGMLGFSAGAFTAMNVACTANPESMPDFLACLYGPSSTPELPVPVNPPPLWAALAADDPLVGDSDFGLFNAWRAHGGTAEFHLHDGGGHGYGFAGVAGTTTSRWPSMFLDWLRVRGVASEK